MDFKNEFNYYENIRNARGACGKVKFSKKDAATKRNALLKEGNEKMLRIYACSDCLGAWHLTKAPFNNGLRK